MPTGVCPQHTNNNGEVRVGKMNFHTLLPLDIALQVEHQEFIIVVAWAAGENARWWNPLEPENYYYWFDSVLQN